MLDIFAELSGLTRAVTAAVDQLRRIADALERLSPPIPEQPEPSKQYAVGVDKSDAAFSFAESPEEYEARTSADAAFAVSLGFAPWSPALQAILDGERERIMKITEETDADGNIVPVSYTREQADRLIRDSFARVRAQANERRESKEER